MYRDAHRQPFFGILMATEGNMIRPLLALASIPCLAAAAPTFSKDVAPIFYRHCAGCHHPNDIAPMSLVDYQSARPRSGRATGASCITSTST